MKKNIGNKNSTSHRENLETSDVSKIFQYIAENNLEEIKIVVNNQKNNLNITNEKGEFPIHVASSLNKREIVQYLIDIQGAEVANIKTLNKSSISPLHRAASTGSTEVVELLLNNNADKEAITHDDFESTPLWIAVFYGHINVVKLLVDKGANKEAKASQQMNEHTPLRVAIINKHCEIIKFLINNGADHKNCFNHTRHETAVGEAVHYGDPQVVKTVLESGCKITNVVSSKSEIQDMINIASLVHTMCFLANINNENLIKINMHRDFAINVFSSYLIENGLVNNSFSDFESNFKKLYLELMPSDLFGSCIKVIESHEQTFIERVQMIESSLIQYFFDISPIPYSTTLEEQKFCPMLATPQAIEEKEKYLKFWNNIDNAKYKIPGVYILELMTTNSASTNIIALTDIMLRAHFLTEDIRLSNDKINPLENVQKDILALNRITLPHNIKEAFDNTLKDYNKFKNDPILRSMISYEDTIELQKEEIACLKQEQQQNKHEIIELKKLVNKLFSHINLDQDLNENEESVDIDVPLSHNLTTLGSFNEENYSEHV